MMIYLFLSIMTQMFFPGGQHMMALQAQAFESHLRAHIDAPAPTSALLGAAGHVVRYQPLKLAS